MNPEPGATPLIAQRFPADRPGGTRGWGAYSFFPVKAPVATQLHVTGQPGMQGKS